MDAQLGFGVQGGQVESAISLDLSTCLNGYGPAPAAITAMRSMSEETIRQHPYDAVDRAEVAFARHHGVEASSVVATRGASEAIWHLPTVIGDRKLVLPVPTYTEMLGCFPHAERVRGAVAWHDVEQLANVAASAEVLLFSNPQNPTGRFVSRHEIEGLANEHPQCLFVVDASYGEFLHPAMESLIGCDARNVVVITSPTKFYGIGGVRVGAVWSRDEGVLRAFRSQRTNWPLSSIEVAAVEAALADVEWASGIRGQLQRDGEWLQQWLIQQPAVSPIEGPLHFRVLEGDVIPFHDRLRAAGVASRLLGAAHGFEPTVLRISAPIEHQRSELARRMAD